MPGEHQRFEGFDYLDHVDFGDRCFDCDGIGEQEMVSGEVVVCTTSGGKGRLTPERLAALIAELKKKAASL